MAEPRGHTLTQTSRVINRTIDAQREASPWREVVVRKSARRGPALFTVTVCERDPARIEAEPDPYLEDPTRLPLAWLRPPLQIDGPARDTREAPR